MGRSLGPCSSTTCGCCFHSKELIGLFSTLGVQAVIGFIRNTLNGKIDNR